MDDEPAFGIRVPHFAGVGAAVIIFLVIFFTVMGILRRKRRARSVRQPAPARSPQPQPPPINTHSVPPHNQQYYQTPLETAPFPAPPTYQSSQPNPAVPPTTYNPRATNIHIHHVQPQSQSRSQRQQQQRSPNNRFNSDDLISFDATGDDKNSPCPICLGTLDEEPISTGQCLHLMHTSCLKSWLAKDAKTACPVCRLPYTDGPQAPPVPTTSQS